MPGTDDLGFKLWADRGISKISDLYENDTLLSFTKIKQRINIEPKHFFKYLQIRSFITKTQNSVYPLFFFGKDSPDPLWSSWINLKV